MGLKHAIQRSSSTSLTSAFYVKETIVSGEVGMRQS
jgi:hypothetical protein